MFGGKKDNQFAKGGHTLFDRALEIEGNVRFAGTLDVEGVVNGDIQAVDSTDALIRVREKGCVNGDIHAPKIIVNGRVNGNVFATRHLELAAKAEVNGNVHYQVIEMVKGAQVNGSLVHIEVEPKPAEVSEAAKPADSKAASSASASAAGAKASS